MNLKILGSCSSGNSYVFDNGDEALLLEAGIKFADVKKALNWNINKVAGCLITHQHTDHSKYLNKMVDAGLYTLALPEVWEAKKIYGSRCISIQLGKGYKFGNFKVMPFPACHDVPCVGYIIEHPDMGKLMFLTDSFMCEYTFPGINHMLIECNYSDDKLIARINAGETFKYQRDRLQTSHMELNICKSTLLANDLSKVEEIVLIHLSKDNGDAPVFVKEIEKTTGKVVYAAHPGLQIELKKII